MSRFPFEELPKLTEAFGLSLDNTALERMEQYAELLLTWNEKMNLTAITDPTEVVYKHFYDCLLFFKAHIPATGAKVIDVGTGAGFPGMVLKIVRPDLNITLLDSLNKRLLFLNDVLDKLGLTAHTVHGRAEEYGQKPAFREAFDCATARAVAPLNVLAEYCLPFVKEGGIFVSLKGPSGEEEMKNAQKAFTVLGAQKPTLICETVPPNQSRCLIVSKKISQTPTKYPRNTTKMTKQPL